MRTFNNILLKLCFALCFSFTFAQSDIQTVRIDFQNTEGYTRHLALGFVQDNSATDSVDYGYDAPNIEDLQDDLNWMIDGNRYIIQGVGEFNSESYYPLGMFLTNTGDITISLNSLEDFETEIDVYIYDLEQNTYTLLNNTSLNQYITAGNYVNRFFVTFTNTVDAEISANYLLSTNENNLDEAHIWYSSDEKALHINDLNANTLITLYSIDGKKIISEQSSDEIYVIDTSGISSGIYLITIENSVLSQSTKVCITN